MSTYKHNPNFELALKQLDRLEKRDPSNGMLHYVRAAVYVRKSDWSAATRELKAGNSATMYQEYQFTGPLDINMYPGFPQLRAMVNTCAKAAPALGFAEGATLLSELRMMGSRICRAKPEESICPLAGVTMRSIAERALADLYQKHGKTADAEPMRKRQQADVAWRKSAVTLVNAQSPYDWGKNTLALALKHGVSAAEYSTWGKGEQSEAAKKRFIAFKKDADAQEHALTEKLLKSMPE